MDFYEKVTMLCDFLNGPNLEPQDQEKLLILLEEVLEERRQASQAEKKSYSSVSSVA